jgi:mandelamide amidase
MNEDLFTSEEYVGILVDRIQGNPDINAFVHLQPDAARRAARQADRVRDAGEATGPLHGLPIIVKDSVHVAGVPSTAGTPALGDFQPDDNAPVIQSLLDAGAIVLGKTNLHELSLGFTTNNAFTGATLNPYDFGRIPGGSSGGNGAALAANFAPLALGEDTSGSVRVPAALTGTMGFRPTTGRYSRQGVAPLSTSLDTLGPMARSVEDLARLDGAIANGPIHLDPVKLSELKVGVIGGHFTAILDSAVASGFDRVLQELEAAGVELVEVELPSAGQASIGAALGLITFEFPLEMGAYLAEHAPSISVDELVARVASPSVAASLEGLQGLVDEAGYRAIVEEVVPAIRQSYMARMDGLGLDAMVYPTTPVQAAPIGAATAGVRVGESSMSTFDAYARNAHFMPLVGAPVVTLPIHGNHTRLPLGGVDVAGRPGSDRKILSIARAIARIMPRRRPPQSIRPIPFTQ